MAGAITISTLKNDTGVLAVQNGMTGIAKAWCNFNGSTGAILASFNVSSITKNGTGDYTFSYTTALASANYSTTGMGSNGGGGTGLFVFNAANNTAPSTTVVRLRYTDQTSSLQDSTYQSMAVFSS